MKLITLNIWAGKIYEPLIEFVKRYKDDTDIFCFQEVFHTETEKTTDTSGFRVNIHAELALILSDFETFFCTAQEGLESNNIKADYHLEFGMALFTKKNLKVEEKGEIFVFRHKNAVEDNELKNMGRNIQHITFNKEEKTYSLVNFHGLWNGQGKYDTEDRLEQSRKVKACLDGLPGAKILCGDFNLMPDTESLKILEKGMRNLIIENGITNTRSVLYTKELRFADYILVSPDINVTKFKVLQEVVSDHLPLVVEFS